MSLVPDLRSESWKTGFVGLQVGEKEPILSPECKDIWLQKSSRDKSNRSSSCDTNYCVCNHRLYEPKCQVEMVLEILEPPVTKLKV